MPRAIDDVWSAATARLAQAAPALHAAPHVRLSLAAHAPYSVSAALFQLLRRERRCPSDS